MLRRYFFVRGDAADILFVRGDASDILFVRGDASVILFVRGDVALEPPLLEEIAAVERLEVVSSLSLAALLW